MLVDLRVPSSGSRDATVTLDQPLSNIDPLLLAEAQHKEDKKARKRAKRIEKAKKTALAGDYTQWLLCHNSLIAVFRR